MFFPTPDFSPLEGSTALDAEYIEVYNSPSLPVFAQKPKPWETNAYVGFNPRRGGFSQYPPGTTPPGLAPRAVSDVSVAQHCAELARALVREPSTDPDRKDRWTETSPPPVPGSGLRA